MNRFEQLAIVVAWSCLSFMGEMAGAQESDDHSSPETLVEQAVLGPVSVTVGVAPAEPLIGDTITVSIEVVSEPMVEVLMPEFGEALDRYRILDFAPTQKIRDDGKTLSKQTYRLQPPMSGKQSIPPILIEFVDGRPNQKPSPDDYDAFELLTPRIDFVVESVTPTDATTDLKPPLGKLQIGEETNRLNHRAFWWMGVMIVILIGAGYWWFRRPPEKVRRRSAFEIARQRLDILLQEQLPSGSDEVDAFYVELSGIVRQYLEDRFELRAPELTTEEFLDKVTESPDLNREHQQLLRDFLRQADLVKFAGIASDESTIRASIDAANRFINETQPQSTEAANG
ncbi:hypothetical protein ACFL2H_02280 [Planctomycetota bacterium]